MKVCRLGVFVFVLFLSAGLVSAQEPVSQRLKKEKAAQFIEDFRLTRIINTLELSEEQLARFHPKWRGQRELRESWMKERREIVAELREFLEAKRVSSRKLRVVLEQLDRAQEDFETKQKALKAEIDEILTIEQRAKWIVLQGQINKEIRRLVRGLRERKRR